MTSHLNNNLLLRTALYVPAANLRAASKADSLGADAVILDLEDAVAPESKQSARAALREIPASQACLRIIRVNGAGTPWHEEDVAAAAALQPHAIQCPKVSSKDDVLALRALIKKNLPSNSVAIWAMIETPLGVLNVAEIAASLGQGGVLVLGLNDLAKESGMHQQAGRLPMLPVLTQTVLAARAYGVGILDGVFNAIGDETGFLEECQQGKAFGFDGKTVIHPRQIAPANAVFGPSEQEIDEAKTIVSAFNAPENQARGVIAISDSKGTRMVELMHLEMAKAVLDKASRIKTTAKE